jgi:hypothetical protein
MTTQDLYTKLSKGEITEQKFLYEVRRDARLPWITSHNSFKDTITILKNKGMISEKQTKESTGKQEVEIIAKTIDMVNPYEYSKGMDFELDLVYNAVGNADLTEDEVLKAQKKVLKNLTKNPSYYTEKMSHDMEGESEYDVEVNAKSIAALEKKNKSKKGKIIREHGEYADRVADVNADSSPLEELDGTGTVDAINALIGAGGLVGGAVALNKVMDALESGKLGDTGKKAAETLRSLGKTFSGGGLKEDSVNELDGTGTVDAINALIGAGGLVGGAVALNKVMDALESGKLGDTGKKAAKTLRGLGKTFSGGGLKEHGEYADRVADVNADSSPLEEEEVEELGRKRDAIYEKYAQKYGVDVNELKDKVEARKLEMEAIEVDNEDAAIAIQKKSPDAKVVFKK